MAASWTVLVAPRFTRQMRQYLRDEEMRKKVNDMVNILKDADDPKRMGDRKTGRFKDVYGIKLTKQHRLLYKVSGANHTVTLYEIGNHKVYRR